LRVFLLYKEPTDFLVKIIKQKENLFEVEKILIEKIKQETTSYENICIYALFFPIQSEQEFQTDQDELFKQVPDLEKRATACNLKNNNNFINPPTEIRDLREEITDLVIEMTLNLILFKRSNLPDVDDAFQKELLRFRDILESFSLNLVRLNHFKLILDAFERDTGIKLVKKIKPVTEHDLSTAEELKAQEEHPFVIGDSFLALRLQFNEYGD
jgi:hypothetical protein